MIVALAALLSWIEGLWLRMSDLFYHVAGVASLLTNNQPLVTDPMFGVKGLPVDPTSGTFHTFLALVARLGGTSAMQTFEWLEPVVVSVYFLAFYALARRILGSGKQAVFALALFAGVVWSADFRVVIYPKWLALGVYWMGLVFFVTLLERFDRRALIFTCVLAVTAGLVHLSAGELWVLTMAAAVAWSLLLIRQIEDGRAVALRCAAAAGLSLVVLAPVMYKRSASVLTGAKTSVFNPPPGIPMSDLPFTKLLDGLGIIRGGLWYQGGDLMLAFVVVATAALVVWALKRGAKPETVVLAATASIMPALMLNLVGTKLLVTEYWFHLRRMSYVLRFVPALLLPYVVALTRDERRLGPTASRTALHRSAVAIGVVAIFLGIAAFSWVEVAGAFNRFINPASLDNFVRQRHNVVTATTGVTQYLASNSASTQAVAADEKMSYYLSALVPVRVIAVRRSHMPLAVEVRDGPQRRHDQEQIFDPRVTAAKTALLLRRWNVGYLVSSTDPALLEKFDRMHRLRRVYTDDRFVAFRVERNGS